VTKKSAAGQNAKEERRGNLGVQETQILSPAPWGGESLYQKSPRGKIAGERESKEKTPDKLHCEAVARY